MHRRAITAASLAAGTALATVVTAASPASAANTPGAVANSRPTWTAHTRALGHAGAAVHARVYLAPQGGLAAEKAYAAALSTQGSVSYRNFLTAAQYRARFAPTAASVHAVSAYLRASGLHVTSVASANRYLSVTGTVHAAEHAFGTTINRYRHSGQYVQAPSTVLTVPGAIAGSLLTVTGLDTTVHVAKTSSVTPASPPPAGFRNGRPCSAYYGQLLAKYKADYATPLIPFKGKTLPYAVCGYTGPQFRAAYEGKTALDGTGVTVGIIDAYSAPSINADANTYAVRHGDGAYRKGQLTKTVAAQFVAKNQCGPSGWYGEETLDVEAVHAMAPGANIHYYGAASCNNNDLLDTLATVVGDDAVQLVTNSYGDRNGEEDETVDSVAAEESVLIQGAIEGISFMFSSGDDGDLVAKTGLKQAPYPASDPYVTGVGGTADAIGRTGNFLFQTGWGTDSFILSRNSKAWKGGAFLYGAGGGSSALFPKPAYQDGTARGAARQVPDVAMDADVTTGMLIGETQAFSDGTYYDEYRIGGTSLASPLFAGMTALKLQALGGPIGLLNPTIYAEQSTGFTDITGPAPDAGNVRVNNNNGEDPSNGLTYFVRTFDQDSSLTVTPGYDNVTGVGAANPGWLTTAG